MYRKNISTIEIEWIRIFELILYFFKSEKKTLRIYFQLNGDYRMY